MQILQFKDGRHGMDLVMQDSHEIALLEDTVDVNEATA